MNDSKKVADKLIKKGWKVFDIKHDHANGIDLTISKNERTYRVEIKRAFKTARAWRINKVGKSGINCELLIIILPNEDIIIQPMKEHLILCTKSGNRHITELVESNL